MSQNSNKDTSEFLTLPSCLNLWSFLSIFGRLPLFVNIILYNKQQKKLKLAGIALKQPKMLRKHHKFRQRDKVRNSDVFLLLFLTLNNDRLNPYTNPYNISVTQQRFSLVSLGYLWSNISYL